MIARCGLLLSNFSFAMILFNQMKCIKQSHSEALRLRYRPPRFWAMFVLGAKVGVPKKPPNTFGYHEVKKLKMRFYLRHYFLYSDQILAGGSFRVAVAPMAVAPYRQQTFQVSETWKVLTRGHNQTAHPNAPQS